MTRTVVSAEELINRQESIENLRAVTGKSWACRIDKMGLIWCLRIYPDHRTKTEKKKKKKKQGRWFSTLKSFSFFIFQNKWSPHSNLKKQKTKKKLTRRDEESRTETERSLLAIANNVPDSLTSNAVTGRALIERDRRMLPSVVDQTTNFDPFFRSFGLMIPKIESALGPRPNLRFLSPSDHVHIYIYISVWGWDGEEEEQVWSLKAKRW